MSAPSRLDGVLRRLLRRTPSPTRAGTGKAVVMTMAPPAKVLDRAKAADLERLRDQITSCLASLRGARDVFEWRPGIENESQVVRLTDRLDYLLNKHPRETT